MNIGMVDTLCAIVDVEDYEENTYSLIQFLQEKKKEAKLVAANNASDKVILDIGKYSFEILPNGSKGYAFILHNDEYEVKLSEFRSKNKDFFPIFIKIKSECLWAKGVEKAWDDITLWIDRFLGEISSNKVTRLDLCCHTDELELSPEDFETFKGNFFNESMRRYRRKVNSIELGSRTSKNIYCRIYNKVLEIEHKSKKFWFYEIWEKAGLNPQKVWNVEFQIDRNFFKEKLIESVEDAFTRLKNIWEYCTKEWLVKVDLVNTRIERCPTNETWKCIQQAFSGYSGIGLTTRDKQLESDAAALLPGTVGNLTSYAARLGSSDIENILIMVKKNGTRLLASKNKNFCSAILEKIALLKQEESEVK